MDKYLSSIFSKGFLIVLVSLLFSTVASAQNVGNDQEREKLGMLLTEIETIKEIAVQAKIIAENDTRIIVNYDWLIGDIEKLQQGIEEILNHPSSLPRKVTPLRGGYIN